MRSALSVERRKSWPARAAVPRQAWTRRGLSVRLARARCMRSASSISTNRLGYMRAMVVTSKAGIRARLRTSRRSEKRVVLVSRIMVVSENVLRTTIQSARPKP